MRLLKMVAVVLTIAASVSQAQDKKMPIRGLTAMGSIHVSNDKGLPDNSMKELFVHPGVYRGAVINVRWNTIEPARGKFDFSSIDEGLAAIAKYNAKYPKPPVVGKLRVFVGTNVPAWVAPLAGGVLHVTHKGEAADYTPWWTPGYRAEWKALQVALAAKYDANPLMGEIAAASCANSTDESFLFPHGPDAMKLLHEAGYTDALERACLLGATDDYSPYKITPVDITFSQFTKTDDKVEEEYTVPLEVMKKWREVFGERGVLSNHSAQDPISKHLQPVYAELKQMGQPIEIQTAAEGVIDHGKEHNGQPGASRDKNLPPLMDWNKVIQNALDIGANEIEIWTTVDAGGHAKITQAMLNVWAEKLK